MKNTNGKTIALVALVVSVLGLSIGFAAFSSTLTINSSATVTPDKASFKIAFGAGTVNPTGKGEVTLTAGTDGLMTIAGITAQLSKPGDTVTYTIPVNNTGSYDAYLKTVTFTPATTKCTAVAATGANAVTKDLMDTACANITLKASIGDDTELANLTATKSVTTTHKLAKGDGTENVVLTITYGGSTDVDGDVKVDFGSIKLDYSSAQ